MFRKFTVLIIGAGAGFDIDMPTGEQLTNSMAQGLDIRFEGGERKSGDIELQRCIARKASMDRVDANMLFAIARNISKGIYHTKSIDNFCHTHRDNPNVQRVAKVAIVHRILKAERGSPLFINRSKHPFVYRDAEKIRKSWLQSFMQILQDGTDACTNLKTIFNNLIIFNFNYDRCIEHYLYHSLQELYGIDPSAAAELMNNLKIHHPYGLVGRLPWQEGAESEVEFGASSEHDDVDVAAVSGNIRTYNEEVPANENLQTYKTLMLDAVRSIFLGFHFHRQNVEILKTSISDVSVRHAYATTTGRSQSDIPIIESRIRNLLPTNRELFCHIDRRLDCIGLFRLLGHLHASGGLLARLHDRIEAVGEDRQACIRSVFA